MCVCDYMCTCMCVGLCGNYHYNYYALIIINIIISRQLCKDNSCGGIGALSIMIIRSEHIKMTEGKARIYSTGYAAPKLGA